MTISLRVSRQQNTNPSNLRIKFHEKVIVANPDAQKLQVWSGRLALHHLVAVQHVERHPHLRRLAIRTISGSEDAFGSERYVQRRQ